MLKKIHAYIVDELMFLPILIVNWSLWIVSGFHKVSRIITKQIWVAPNGWIPWLHTHFHGTFLDPFVVPLFFILTFLQVLAGLLLTVALFKLEFLDYRKKDFFKAGLFVGAFTIAVMSFGQNIANADEDIFQLSSYLTTTLVSYLFCSIPS
ncbi:hypothetical protein CbuD7D7780_09940 [Coxiella burnetii]|uniref:Hypothetical membrane spanning protein n=1 Tax=Coxiella burnetii (strain Dugway 5J108-111) TaxID=434922 RepID=A9KEM2_COXBN|nr:hypothetical protein [Coxiella burnetii]ABS78293.1 hypothetical membrane spanning protein [Coxiella burnetii Dugway 5J108-111]OYK79403.1 hypothetical protein CbuD7E6568_09925 [Coxiella burnetii]OYK81484.1 hypothetical protein CbuD7D7780_09940 [Coxiella burnetii]